MERAGVVDRAGWVRANVTTFAQLFAHLEGQLLDQILAEHTGQTIEKVKQDTDRDFIMTAEQAKEYGIIDDVFAPRKMKPELAAAAAGGS